MEKFDLNKKLLLVIILILIAYGIYYLAVQSPYNKKQYNQEVTQLPSAQQSVSSSTQEKQQTSVIDNSRNQVLIFVGILPKILAHFTSATNEMALGMESAATGNPNAALPLIQEAVGICNSTNALTSSVSIPTVSFSDDLQNIVDTTSKAVIACNAYAQTIQQAITYKIEGNSSAAMQTEATAEDQAQKFSDLESEVSYQWGVINQEADIHYNSSGQAF